MGDLKSENPGVPGGGGFTILKTPGTPGVGDWDYRGVSQTLLAKENRLDLPLIFDENKIVKSLHLPKIKSIFAFIGPLLES